MANLQMQFDPDSVEPRSLLDPVPANEYISQIIESDVGAAKTGQGLILKLTWEILDGEFTGRKFWQNINYQHNSAQAQTIGQQELGEICSAVGHGGHLEDSEQLHFKPARVRVVVKEDKGYAPKNEVKSVKPLEAQPSKSQAATSRPASATTAKAQTTTQGATAKSVTTSPGTAPAPGSRPWKSGAAAPR